MILCKCVHPSVDTRNRGRAWAGTQGRAKWEDPQRRAGGYSGRQRGGLKSPHKCSFKGAGISKEPGDGGEDRSGLCRTVPREEADGETLGRGQRPLTTPGRFWMATVSWASRVTSVPGVTLLGL